MRTKLKDFVYYFSTSHMCYVVENQGRRIATLPTQKEAIEFINSHYTK